VKHAISVGFGETDVFCSFQFGQPFQNYRFAVEDPLELEEETADCLLKWAKS